MKKNIPLLTAITCIILFSSCQKDAGGGPTTVTDKVKTYTEDITSPFLGNSVTTYNLSYDGSNRISSMISTSDPGDKFIFTYNSATTYSMDIYNSNVRVIHVDFFLNSNSYPDSTFQYNDTEDSSTTKNIYNTNNQLIRTYDYDYSKITGSDLWNTTTYTYDAAGNMLKAEDTDTNIETYEYYPDLVYVLPVITPYAQPKKLNLVKKFTLASNGSVVGSATYTYTFDSKNRISTERAVTTEGTIILKTYTYF